MLFVLIEVEKRIPWFGWLSRKKGHCQW